MNKEIPPSVSRKIPVITTAQLEAFGPPKCGLSVYNGIIVLWDQDYDTRVLQMIDERFPIGQDKPIAVREYKGTINLLWKSKDDAFVECFYQEQDDYTTEGDCWSASHYFQDGNTIKEMRGKYNDT